MRFDPWQWVVDPWWIAAIVIFAVWYVWAARVNAVPWWRRASFFAGLGLVSVGLFSPIEHVALDSMLSFHLLQNVMLADWAPPLLVLGVTPALAALAERSAVVRWGTSPPLALCYWLAAWYVVHVPAIYGYALRHHWGLGVEHLLFLSAGIMFWWPVLVAGRMRPGPRIVYLSLAFFAAAPVALVIALSGSPLYPYYATTPHLWGLRPLEDQQIGGMLMAVEQSALLFVATAWSFVQLISEDGRAPEPLGFPT